jgi:hypothetical protein
VSHPNLLNTSDTVLLVIDVQDVLLKAIHEPERVVGNSVRLIERPRLGFGSKSEAEASETLSPRQLSAMQLL